MANIRLNILPISENTFSFKVYRKNRENDEPIEEDGLHGHSLPISDDAKIRKNYYISFKPRADFNEYDCSSHYAISLTLNYLHNALLQTLIDKGVEHKAKRKFANQTIEFVVKNFKEGDQLVVLTAHYYNDSKKFGFLTNFKFSKNEGQKFDKQVQIRSLSLSSNGRSNKDYYADKFRIINQFLSNILQSVSKFGINNSEFSFQSKLIDAPVLLLDKKEYIFNNKKFANSQFQGIRNYGPLKKVEKQVVFIFIFEDKFKSFANELYLSLKGKSNPGTFPGYEKMFGITFTKDNVKRIQINDYSNDGLKKVVTQAKDIQNENPNKLVIGIYIEDCSIDQIEKEASDRYYFMKYNFIKNNLALQVINYRKHSQSNSLKWSSSNIALAMFSKLGGTPWLVKPSNNNCLILGIGNSHSYDPETKETTKFFAYTVCLDSSGEYKTLEVLSNEVNENSYLSNLESNLTNLLSQGNFSVYQSCVLHLPFKIRNIEIESIKRAIAKITKMNFVVLKINTKNKYFGYSYHNTLVPYESSFVKLSRSEYLVWFEGLHYGKEVVSKRLSSPVHIQFLRFGDLSESDEQRYLQDVLNLSGANWRGFNAKSIPISIYYAKIIAKYSKEFETILDYDKNLISNSKPWFL